MLLSNFPGSLPFLDKTILRLQPGCLSATPNKLQQAGRMAGHQTHIQTLAVPAKEDQLSGCGLPFFSHGTFWISQTLMLIPESRSAVSELHLPSTSSAFPSAPKCSSAPRRWTAELLLVLQYLDEEIAFPSCWQSYAG